MQVSSSVRIKKRSEQGASFNGWLSWFLLPFILLVQASTSLLLLNNTPFQDEALYLLAGHQILLRWQGQATYLEPYGLYFSGYPFFYPPIAGLLDLLGGLEMARLFSLLCMLIATTCVYGLTLRLFDRTSALLAAFIFACGGSVLFVGRLATYDALCCCLLALALTFCLWASQAASDRRLLVFGPLLMLMVAAKYAGLLFIPTILALLAWWSWQQQGWREMLDRLHLALTSLIITGLLAFLVMDQQALTGMNVTTINRVSLTAAPALVVIGHIATTTGIFFALGLLALPLCGRKRVLTGLLFFGSALLVPLYHTTRGEMVSLDKHLAFCMIFLAPLVGYITAFFVNVLHRYMGGLSWLAVLALCLLIFLSGIQQASLLYEGWPSSTQLTTFLQPQVHKGKDHYLAEDYDVLRYSLQKQTDIWQWSSLDYFVYIAADKRELSGEAAYTAAIQAGYFEMIELSYGYHAALARHITQSLNASQDYQLVARIPMHSAYGDGSYWIWRKRVTAANDAALVGTGKKDRAHIPKA
ncbi:MAG TPA: glycosyltransferase family 39 protein [Ktedonobacteraceae bacterium]|nr:glycosyltransferase family 39 protein [Ktedonobacteraceae bacterium]